MHEYLKKSIYSVFLRRGKTIEKKKKKWCTYTCVRRMRVRLQHGRYTYVHTYTLTRTRRQKAMVRFW